MKSNDVYFEATNFIGREVENIQEVVNGMTANMNFANQDGLGFMYDVEMDDGSSFREPTHQEVFERIQECLNDSDNKVYVGYFLDMKQYRVVPYNSTMLQSDLFIGKEVYIMQNNKIVKARVITIQIVKGYNSTRTNVFENTRYKVVYKVNGYEQEPVVLEKDEVFATKDELLEHISNDTLN